MTKKTRFFNILQICFQFILSAIYIINAIKQNLSSLEKVIIMIAIIANLTIYHFRNR